MTSPQGLAAPLLRDALAGEPSAVRDLLRRFSPVIQARVARVLVRRRGATGRDPRQEIEDLTQEVFLSLFDDDARALRAWKPELGLSLDNFVGLVAERQAASILRSGRRSPWTEDPTESDELYGIAGSSSGPESSVGKRELIDEVLLRLRAALTPRTLALFYALFVDEKPVATICAEMQMQPQAVYTARNRIATLIARIGREIDDASADSGRSRRTPARSAE